jgi:hypothetical protein
MLNEAVYYTRMAWGMRTLGKTKPPADPEAVIRWQLANRETTFLELVRGGIFENPRTPYREMFRLAGCEFGDLVQGVKQNGLEPTLETLRAQGVYLTHDEFKCKEPIVRGGLEIASDQTCFHNPAVKALFRGRSSGSRSRRTPTPYSLEFMLFREAHADLRHREVGLTGRAHVMVRATLPAPNGLRQALRAKDSAFPGTFPIERWFAPGGDGALHYRLATHAIARFSQVRWNDWTGSGALLPTYLPANDLSPVAEWIARRQAAGTPAAVTLSPSNATKVANIALTRGIDISGAIFLSGAEAISDAKRALVRSAGVEIYGSYPMSEIGTVGHACSHMIEGNSVHVYEDTVAVSVERRRAPFSEDEMNVLLYTTLVPCAGQVLVNADMGDTGILAPADCDCLFSRMGLRRQIRDIASYSKLTGHGVTLVGTDVVRVLEEFLPLRLGGAPGDYQLVQNEGDADTKVTLRVSPRVGELRPEKVKALFLEGVRGYYGGAMAVRLWQHAEAVDVVFAEPLTTVTGKVLSLFLAPPARRNR